MGCSSCGTSADGKPSGCKSNGGCSSGGCNKLNTYDWLAKMDIVDYSEFDSVEISFKNGSRKAFYHNPPHVRAIIGDMVVVESASGYDVGRISLTGELVRLQMKKKRVSPDAIFPKIIRIANQRDIEKLEDARSLERNAMIRARAIARTLDLDMKLGDVEYQGDRRKATFYYTADGRVDFRELIRHYAKEFKVKIEMRQIGARQESARIGGLGSCGRELCCSTWLTNFKSVTTGAARYQNLAINQSKLSGQCGRLKCCLNYELDTYLDALQDFPSHHERLETEAGRAVLIKTDIFKRKMVYTYETPGKRGNFYTLSVDRVKAIMAMNAAGEKPMELVDKSILLGDEEVLLDFEDVTGAVELPPEKRSKRKPRGSKRNFRNKEGNRGDRNRSDKSSSGNRDDRSRRSDKPRPNRDDRRPKDGKPFSNRDDRRPKDGKPSNNRDDRRPKDGKPSNNRDDRRPKDGKPSSNRDDRRPKDGKPSNNRDDRRPKDGKPSNNRDDRRPKDGKPSNNRDDRRPKDGKPSSNRDDRRPKDGKPSSNRDDRRPKEDKNTSSDKPQNKPKERRSFKNKFRRNPKPKSSDKPNDSAGKNTDK